MELLEHYEYPVTTPLETSKFTLKRRVEVVPYIIRRFNIFDISQICLTPCLNKQSQWKSGGREVQF